MLTKIVLSADIVAFTSLDEELRNQLIEYLNILEFLVFINVTSQLFGFREGVLMKPEDFKKHIEDVMIESAKDLRGSEFKVFGYEVW